MRCDYCNCQLAPANDGGYAPNGLPLYICKICYQKLKSGKLMLPQESGTLLEILDKEVDHD